MLNFFGRLYLRMAQLNQMVFSNIAYQPVLNFFKYILYLVMVVSMYFSVRNTARDVDYLRVDDPYAPFKQDIKDLNSDIKNFFTFNFDDLSFNDMEVSVDVTATNE